MAGLSGENEEVYRCMVVDSGPIIKLTGVSSLWKKANSFYTVPTVLQEIKDQKAREHLDNLPFDLVPKEPSAGAIKAVIDFARQTGDYQSLSSVDIQVLALLYQLEQEGCGSMSHIRTTPKRTVGVGKYEMMAGETKSAEPEKAEVDEGTAVGDGEADEVEVENKAVEVAGTHTPENKAQQVKNNSQQNRPKDSGPPKSWAALLGGSSDPVAPPSATKNVAEANAHVPFGQMNISPPTEQDQFDDADEDEEDEEENVEDPAAVGTSDQSTVEKTTEEELQLEFPSLSAAMTVPYDGSDDEAEEEAIDEEERKRRSLQPVSKSGKLYQKDSVVKMLTKPSQKGKKNAMNSDESEVPTLYEVTEATGEDNNHSRIIGGMTLAGQEADVEDDGEGWITTKSEIQTMKANGALDPGKKGTAQTKPLNDDNGPPLSQRAACTTTDFAMQNVILQMNLELLSVDGMKVRKLKSWVRRCGACFKVYTDADNTGPIQGKRLFCEHCGSDMIQRIACSVDGKTGRLRLHLSKKYQHNLRGTKFSLPKPNSGDRFQGDLLLREDQLMMSGTWNQKAKMRGGGKAKAASESIFGRDIAKNVGCHVNSLTGDDIQVGFGRRNPNAAKGRERRGKKKKAANKACGLRRY